MTKKKFSTFFTFEIPYFKSSEGFSLRREKKDLSEGSGEQITLLEELTRLHFRNTQTIFNL